MATYEKNFLLDGTNDNGEPEPLQTTSTTLHQVPASPAAGIDEVWIWLSNNTTSDRVVTLELGSTAAAQNAKIVVPAQSVVLAVPGIPAAASQVISALVDSTNDSVVAFGYVNRIG